MKAGDGMHKTNQRKTVCLIIFLMAAVGGAVVFAAKAAEHTGMYWIGLDSEFVTERPEDNRGFFTVDVSDFLNSAGTAPAQHPHTYRRGAQTLWDTLEERRTHIQLRSERSGRGYTLDGGRA